MSWRSLTPLEKQKALPVFVADLFFSIHYAAILYVNSSLLSDYFPVTTVGLLFALGAGGNIILFFLAPHLLRRIGNRALFFIFVLVDALATGGMALSHNPHLLAFFFLLFESVAVMIYFCLDIFLEDASLDENTGEIRGIDLTIANAAVVLGPLLIAFLVPGNNFTYLYVTSFLLLLPLFYLAFFSFRLFHDGEAKPFESRFLSAFALWWNDGDVKRITIARFFLEFFYAFMVIYVPIYLHDRIGFSWTEIGEIFTIMLISFVLIQLPAGEAADRWWGEKEMLLIGFFFAGASSLAMPFIGPSFIGWTLALFASRIGAALLEVMSDTYFFKKVDKRDTGLISVFRLSRPAGILAGALWGILVLVYTTYAGIFFTLGAICILGTFVSLRIRDTL